MKILQLISSGGVYGAEVMMVTLAKSLERLGCKNLVGVFNNVHRADCAVEDFVRAQGLLVKSIPCRGKMDWKTVVVIRRCIREERIDLIHTHGYKADILGLRAARRVGIPVAAVSRGWTAEDFKVRLYEFIDRRVLRRCRCDGERILLNHRRSLPSLRRSRSGQGPASRRQLDRKHFWRYSFHARHLYVFRRLEAEDPTLQCQIRRRDFDHAPVCRHRRLWADTFLPDLWQRT